MKKLHAILLALPLLVAGSLPAQETPETQLEFVRQLRQKGLSDLALQYIEKLQKNPPPQLAAILPLEAARTRVQLAQVRPPDERMKLLTVAETELEANLASKKNTPEAPGLKLELARLTMYQGQAFLGQALRLEDGKERDDYAAKARDKFKVAREQKFDPALKELGDLIAKDVGKDKGAKQRLEADLLKGKFDRAKTYVYEARSYLNLDDTKDRLKQAELYKTGKDTLKDIALDKSGADDTVKWLAVAWYIDVGRRAGEGDDALQKYKLLMKASPDLQAVAAAQRVAKYFYIQAVRDSAPGFQPPAGKSKDQFLIEECSRWLKQYKASQNSSEGLGVQFELAYAYLDQALALKKPYTDPKAKQLYDNAEKLFTLVAASHSDLSEKANQQSIGIKNLRIGDVASIDQLKNFEECFLKARAEMFEVAKAGKAIKEFLKDPPPDKDKLKKELGALQKGQRRHLKTVISAFQRGLELATPLTPPTQIDDVRYFLAYTYLMSGDPYRAAVMSEYLARRDPPSKHAALAASYGLQAYEQILKGQDDPVNKDRLRDLANYVLKDRATQWEKEPVTALARYALALFYMRQKDYPQTVEHLEKLPKDFRSYTFAQCQLALIALNMSNEAAQKQDQKAAQEYRRKALQALKNIPTLPENADPATAAMFFNAQLNQGTILYNDSIAFIKEGNDKVAEARLRDMVTFTRDLLKQFAKFRDRIDEKVADRLEGGLENLDKFARYGESRLAYKAGEYDKVLSKELAGDVISRLEALATKGGELALPDFQVTGDLLGLALRAQVQKGNFKEAEKILGLVRKLKNPNTLDDKGNSTTSVILQNLLSDLSRQVDTLKKNKKTDQLKDTIKNFSSFFDVLMAGKDAKTLSYNDRAFLANSYASVDQHDKAARLYADLPQPQLKIPDKATKEEKDKAEAEYKKSAQLWWFLQVRCGEQWRLAREYKKAKSVLENVLNDPKAAAKIQAQYELTLVYEDEGNFRKAIETWNAYLKSPGLLGQMKNPQVPPVTRRKAKEMYYDGFYHYIYSWYMFSQNDGKTKEDKYLAQAANYVWRLELDHLAAAKEAKQKNLEPPTDTGWAMIGDRLRELMENAPKLKKEYEKQKQAAK